MKKNIYFLIFIAGCFFSQQVSAQSYPVQATFQLTPPYSLYLSDYAAADNNRFALNVLLRDLSRQDLQVRLRLTIEGTGVSITTRPDYRPQPLFLQGGMPLMLGAADLGAYFNPENLIFQGISKDQVVRGNALPEGFYRICFEVLEYNLGTEVSNMACGSAWLMLNDPPIINTPFNGEKVRVQDPQTQLFQWTPRHTGSPNSAFSTAYDFELVELWPEGRDPNNAIQSTPPIYETTTYSTSLVYGIAEPPLVPGRRYAFRVRARAINGIEPMDLFKNDGYSEVYSFIYGDACSPPVVVEASTVSSSRIKVSWQTGPAQTEFVVYYRKEGSDDEWQSEKTYLEELTLDGLQPETTYEFQVAALCGAANGGKSGVVTSATSENPVTNYTCGAQPGDIDLENQEALPELNPGDIFKAGDVEVRVINASGSNGTFSGKGHAEMPWLKHVKVRVEFEGIFINTDLQMINGAVTTIFNADSPLMFDLDALGGDDAAEEGGGAEDQAAPFDGTTIKVDGTVASVTVDESGQIIVEKEDGTTETFTQETDPETGERVPTQITDDEGNTYTVDKDGNVSKSSASGPPALQPGAEWDYLVKFNAYDRQNYGLDIKDQSAFTDYNRTLIDSADYYVPWKSMETGQIDYVNATLEGNESFPEVIAFKSAIGGTLGTQPAEAENQKQVMLVGGMPESTQEVYAYVVQEDEEGNETEYTVGQLNMVSYTKERNTVVLVPVNGASIPGNIQQGINDIFKQGVAEWNVQIADSYTVDSETLADLAVPESSGVLASFPSKMRQFNRRFKNSINFDNHAYYLFVIDGDGGDRDGFMPFKRQFGYIWRKNGSIDLAAVVAHELSHGAFRLRHTFSSEAYVTGEGQTNGNLMDYPAGKSLRKYQWDYIHNPESMIGWFQDDEESELSSDIADVQWVDQECSGCSFVSPAGKPFNIPEKVTSLAVMKPAEGGVATSQILKEAIYGFKFTSGESYFARIVDGDFQGYYPTSEEMTDEPRKFAGTETVYGEGMELTLWEWETDNQKFDTFIVNDISGFSAPEDWSNYIANGTVVSSMCMSCVTRDFVVHNQETLDELLEMTAEAREEQYDDDIVRFRNKIKELDQSGRYYYATGNAIAESDEVIIKDKLQSYYEVNQKYNESSNRKIFLVYDEINYALPSGGGNEFAEDVLEGLGISGDITLMIIPYLDREKVVIESNDAMHLENIYYSFGGVSGYDAQSIDMGSNDVKSYFLDIYRNISKPIEIHSYLLDFKGTIQYYLSSHNNVTGYDYTEGLNIYADKDMSIAVSHVRWQNQSASYKMNSIQQHTPIAEKYLEIIGLERSKSDYGTVDFDHNLKEIGIIRAEIRDMFVSDVLAHKYSDLRNGSQLTTHTIPEQYLFDTGNYYEVIDFFGTIAGVVELDFVFDIVGATYAIYRGDEVEAATYASSVFVPFASGATARNLKNMAGNIGQFLSIKARKDILYDVFKTQGDNLLLRYSDDLVEAGIFENKYLLTQIDLLPKTQSNKLLNHFGESDDLFKVLNEDPDLLDIWRKLEASEVDEAIMKKGSLLKKTKKLNCN
ncbi:fibronectin type III domain-containing protein [Fulvivirga maritima]|uniref:fibronectin type III domain-containing protein n=1 Tax=Fulvivirga maritima TaxID=2904247 RepID=UPI001F220712|nr:fibronectin type III domain-containing protein [Fulvivirga maritima]UII29067.1 fibronectin type III domain-containing protein [Fulvivirga maritima]